MAQQVRTIFQWPFATQGKTPPWVLVVGLDGSGLSSILKQLGPGDATISARRPGYPIESLEYKNMKMDSFDVGGCDKYRPLKQRVTKQRNLSCGSLIALTENASGSLV